MAAVAVLGGCESLTGPESTRVLGTLAFEDGEPLITAPDTVRAGQAFTVTVVTEWPDGCAALDETEVRASPTEVHVIPWDRVSEPPDDGDCPASPSRMTHSVTLSRASPAVLGLTVHGRRRQGADLVEIRVTRQLVVRAP